MELRNVHEQRLNAVAAKRAEGYVVICRTYYDAWSERWKSTCSLFCGNGVASCRQEVIASFERQSEAEEMTAAARDYLNDLAGHNGSSANSGRVDPPSSHAPAPKQKRRRAAAGGVA